MVASLREHDAAILTENVGTLKKGEVGTIVFLYGGGSVCELEVAGKGVHTIGLSKLEKFSLRSVK